MTSPVFTAIAVAAGIAWLTAVIAIVRAVIARREMVRKLAELTRRSEQLRLVNRLTVLLAREKRRRGVARVAVQFFVQEMGVQHAVFWRPDGEGEPTTPWVGHPAGATPTTTLPDAHRVILARSAARGPVPLVLANGSEDKRPQTLSVDDPPHGRFALYIPLGASPLEGVLELYCDDVPWKRERWEILSPLTTDVGDALRRARHYEEVREQADLDFVTGLFNHRFIQVYLQRLADSQASRDRSFSVLLFDVNNFKSFNDTFGHSVGDRVLQLVANQLKLMTDRVGLVGRFGGDEFVVVLPEHSGTEAQAFAVAFQDWLTNCSFETPGGQKVPIEVSWGLAAFPEDGDNRQELLAVADARLYQKKRADEGTPAFDRRRRARRRLDTGLGVYGLLDSLVASVDVRDHYTRAHCEKTAEYAAVLAQELGVSPSALKTLRLAALLHDVGKICIPDDILRKPGAITPEEYAVVKHHASIAENLIVDVPNAEEVRKIARHHHERFDGSGYPDGLSGEDIPILARVLAVADAFSAMTLDRPHRESLPPEEALAELQRVAGTQLDPALVRVFGRAVSASEDDAIVRVGS